MIKKVKQIILERWKFYLTGYIIGYLLPIVNDRKITLEYIFPIKLLAIGMAIGLGTAFYYGKTKKNISVAEAVFKGAKCILLIGVIFLFALILKLIIFSLTGFDIIHYIGIPEK